MAVPIDLINVSIPRALLADFVRLSNEMTDRLHQLLEQNTEGALSTAERHELDALTRVAEFGQIMAMAASIGDHQ